VNDGEGDGELADGFADRRCSEIDAEAKTSRAGCEERHVAKHHEGRQLKFRPVGIEFENKIRPDARRLPHADGDGSLWGHLSS
jgi:hypothetical protein